MSILTISSLGLIRSIECRLIACIAALLLLGSELFDDVDSVGDAVPVLSVAATAVDDDDEDDEAVDALVDIDDADDGVVVVDVVDAVVAVEFAGIGFLIIVTGWVTVVCGPFAMRR